MTQRRTVCLHIKTVSAVPNNHDFEERLIVLPVKLLEFLHSARASVATIELPHKAGTINVDPRCLTEVDSTPVRR